MTNGQDTIPDGWRRERLGDISNNVFSGGTPSRSNDSYWGDGHYWLSSSELEKGEIYETDETITQDGLEESSTSVFPKDSLLIAMYGKTRGKSAINRREMTGNQAICCLDLKDDFCTEYAWYQVIKNRPRLISLGGGAGQQNIRQSIIRNLKIPIAPLDEQRRIASVLYMVDEQIRTLTDRHDSLTQLKHGLMQDLLTGETRVTPEIDIREEEFKETSDELSDMETTEESWETVNFDEVAEIITGKSYPSDEYCENGVPLFRISNIGSYNQDDIEMLPDKYYEQTDTSRILNDGNIVMALSGATTGKCSLIKPEIAPCILNQRVGKFVPKTPVRRLFMYYLINSSEFQENVKIMATGAAQDNIGIKDLKSIPVRIPTLWEQERIASVLYTVDEMIARTSDLIDEYERLKRGLMQDLLSGDVRSPEDLEVLKEIQS